MIRNLVGQSYTEPDPDGVSYNPANPDENVRTNTYYSPNGNMIATEDASGMITRTYHDELNRPELVVQNLTGQGLAVTTPPT